ncbi:TetR family transcriptional regulator [Gordonia pseudamarae]|jgi:AcrR family transcriptional regulator|uniref:TetR family transcriptional regulator n=1 Tax=Gordonia pseudamarae TaxID=2831662 RepID=A0ABX6IJV5_9ACTN|nr:MULTISPECIES: TetR/AcrR family transcriptional regulator [Gordonia]MBD0023106.1 TetR/AcrR family transcriptional regulator [Gordonia sp. (in: high G+C Gram-positive bacteria)]QHN27237.1 TetR family transcriptional regulator [Gordonia pseudamarae]QHN36120.1 TetR family transcriptional regulator [Gordonia pseudamarae]
MAAESARKRRANGEESRNKILDAATEIAGERGYEGTSIGRVSKQCGLPASSIYWHFKDKDDLIAAVIERSFADWLSAWELPDASTPRDRVIELGRQVAKSLLASPDFLRLGLMLALERRPEEPRAREKFLQVRAQATERMMAVVRDLAPQLSEDGARQVVLYAIAAADGLFIAKEIGGDDVDLGALFEMHAHAVLAVVSAYGGIVAIDTGIRAPE